MMAGAHLDLLMRALGWRSGLQCISDSGHAFVEAFGFALEMPVDTLQLCRANVNTCLTQRKPALVFHVREFCAAVKAACSCSPVMLFKSSFMVVPLRA